MSKSRPNVDRLDGTIEPMLRAARIPGAAIAVVLGNDVIFAKGYGYREVIERSPVTATTVYPIASTTKAMTATVLGTLVDEGALDWESPVQDYLPRFRLHDSVISAQVTVKDLLSMRTGLPRHDWLWQGYPMSRSELVGRLRYLELSAPFRDRFQYNNLHLATAGHIAEVITGRSWEDLMQERLFNPLGMRATVFSMPVTGDVTSGYHENSRRQLVTTRRLSADVTAPSGGVHSTVQDMARWAMFNLGDGRMAGREIVKARTLADIQSPKIIVGGDAASPSPHATYALCWFVDTYNGHARIAHGGYLHDISSDVALFPQDNMAIISFCNFGCPLPARFLNQCAFDAIHGLAHAQSFEERLAQYEKKIEETRARYDAVPRVARTSASHPLDDYVGVYRHPGYGNVEILRDCGQLIFQRYYRESLTLPLQHWHYDVWVAENTDALGLDSTNPFDATNCLLFETDIDGQISTLSIGLEAAVDRIRFKKISGEPKTDGTSGLSPSNREHVDSGVGVSK